MGPASNFGFCIKALHHSLSHTAAGTLSLSKAEVGIATQDQEHCFGTPETKAYEVALVQVECKNAQQGLHTIVASTTVVRTP